MDQPPRPTTADLLDLSPHPEGGWFRETWRASPESVPDGCPGPRAAATGIYFLLVPGEESAWHRVRSDEVWLWHSGGPLTLLDGGDRDTPSGSPTVATLGPGRRPAAAARHTGRPLAVGPPGGGVRGPRELCGRPRLRLRRLHPAARLRRARGIISIMSIEMIGIPPAGLDQLAEVTSALAADAERNDRTADFPAEGIRVVHRAGLLTATGARRYGGPGGGLADTARILGALGRGDPSVALITAMTLFTHAAQAAAPTWPDDVYRASLAESVAK